MKKILQSIIIATIVAVACTQSGQCQTPDITPEMVQDMIIRGKQYVYSLNKNIAYMANKRNSIADREFTRTSALSMFIGDGYGYEWNGRMSDGVITETTSVRNTAPRRQLTHKYYSRLINMNYPQIEINSTQLHQMKASDLKKVGEGKYEVSICYEQEFRATTDGGWQLYGDRTTKKVKVLIEVRDGIDGKILIIKLGDTLALETSRL
ncbi:MAG: hypothetical protein HDS96_00320 [Bacteroidales bacterium]|nr:hypothetical protein [Bacteroidales bacterium]